MREKFKQQLGIGDARDEVEAEEVAEEGQENFNDVLENEYADD